MEWIFKGERREKKRREIGMLRLGGQVREFKRLVRVRVRDRNTL